MNAMVSEEMMLLMVWREIRLEVGGLFCRQG